MEFEHDDALAKAVYFLSTAETRSKLYRLLQYGAKVSRWSLLQLWGLDDHDRLGDGPLSAAKPRELVAEAEKKDEATLDHRRRLVACLSRAELAFGDSRRFFRLLQFLEMAEMLRRVREPLRVVRVLRRLRILSFFFFYLSENYVAFRTRIQGAEANDARLRRVRRACSGFWLLTILLAFPLDHMLRRGSLLATAKKLLDLPVAFVGLSGHRVSDGLFGALGLASAQIDVYTRWREVMASFRSEQLKRLGVAAAAV